MTTEQNAAVEAVLLTPSPAPEPETKVERKSKKTVTFRSKGEESSSFTFLDVRPVRSAEHPGHFEWVIPADLAERALKHHHVVTGRIVKA